MIGVIDYGVGNVQVFLNAFKRLGCDARRVQEAASFRDLTHLVLPGVGHFDYAMQQLNNSGMRPRLEEMVFELGIPVLGVCVGMQMLATSSDEGKLAGLNWVPGHVRAFAKNTLSASLPIPHMGWNDIKVNINSSLFSQDFDLPPEFYFLHSYYYEADDRRDVTATAHYGFDFDVAVSRGKIHGVQFHPEKSHTWGERLLKNFARSM